MSRDSCIRPLPLWQGSGGWKHKEGRITPMEAAAIVAKIGLQFTPSVPLPTYQGPRLRSRRDP